MMEIVFSGTVGGGCLFILGFPFLLIGVTGVPTPGPMVECVFSGAAGGFCAGRCLTVRRICLLADKEANACEGSRLSTLHKDGQRIDRLVVLQDFEVQVRGR